ncbi:MAG: transglycosylase SLT domain-containing protein [Rhodospirillaceae bacterium]|nr:transglycosylase SLT domain-containing protein [Rhodospirillaceae bacterium]MBT6428763.1 transglycosylase SLT domain-containing protein [Rhodospirillaceae bacterium]
MRYVALFAAFFGAAVFLAAPAAAYLDAEAAYRMALRHHHPLGAKRKNYRHALILYCRADSDDHAGAAFAIGLLYSSGHGVKRNERKAAAWFKRAASLGHGDAKNMLRDLRVRNIRKVAQCPNGWGRGASVAAQMRAPGEIRKLVLKLAPRFRLDPKLVLAVISVESGFQSNAVSSKRAQGLMQLIPATAARFGVRNVFDPADNIRGGMAYLRWLLTHFKGDVTLALAGYNAGEGAVKKYGGVPPYKETRNYVRKIRRLYPADRHPI